MGTTYMVVLFYRNTLWKKGKFDIVQKVKDMRHYFANSFWRISDKVCQPIVNMKDDAIQEKFP